MENEDITTLRQSIEDMRADLNEQIERINGLAELLETALVQATTIGIGIPEEDVEGPNGIVKEKKAPEAALDVRGHIKIAADPPRIYATPNQDSDAGQYLQLIDGKNRSSAFGLKAGGVLVSDRYADTNPAAGELVVQKKVQIGGIKDKDKKPVVGELRVEGNAAVSGDITEGGKTLKEKYQPAGKYQLAGKYLVSGKDAQVKNLTVTGELKIGGATISVVRCKFYHNQHNRFQGYWPAGLAPGWIEHVGWDSDCIMVKTTNGTVYLGPFG